MTSIAITVFTRQRPEMLRKCLVSVLKEISAGPGGDMLVVIENDDTPGCQSAVEALSRKFPDVELIYLHEPKLGIPIARNSALDAAARLNADWIAFVDDDEQVTRGWLDAMRHATMQLGADALTGPVEQLYMTERPDWMGVNKKKPIGHGQSVDTAATNNTLVNMAWLRAQSSPLRFDERLRFTGGSDSEFFYRFSLAGGSIKWVANAVVIEHVPGSRLTMTWQIDRKSRCQANNVRCYRMNNGFVPAAARYLPAAIRRILLRGLPTCVVAGLIALVSRERAALLWYRGNRTIGSGLGALRGLFGRELQPYLSVDGE